MNPFSKHSITDFINSAISTQDKQFDLLIGRLDTIIRLLTIQQSETQVAISKENKLMATLQDVQNAVANQSSVEDSVITLLNGINQQLKDAMAKNDPAALDAVVASITANTTKLSEAVSANTQAPQQAPTVPVETPTASSNAGSPATAAPAA